MTEAVATAHGPRNKIESARGQVQPGWSPNIRPALTKRRDHHAVPIGKNFVVEAGAHPAGAHGEELFAQRRQPSFIGLGARYGLQPVEDIVAFEIAGRRHIVVPCKEFAVLDAEVTDDLVVGPDVEFALLAFGIGIERRRESAFRRGHFALEPGNRFAARAAGRAALPLR